MRFLRDVHPRFVVDQKAAAAGATPGIPAMSLAHGIRTPECNAELVVDLVAPGPGGQQASVFLLSQTAASGNSFYANVTLAFGYETVLVISRSAISSRRAALSLRQWLPGGTLGLSTVPDTVVPAACGSAASAPLCYKPSGSWTSGDWLWAYFASPTPGAFLYITIDGSSPRTSSSAMFSQDWVGAIGPGIMLRFNAPGVTTVRAIASRGARCGGGVIFNYFSCVAPPSHM